MDKINKSTVLNFSLKLWQSYDSNSSFIHVQQTTITYLRNLTKLLASEIILDPISGSAIKYEMNTVNNLF